MVTAISMRGFPQPPRALLGISVEDKGDEHADSDVGHQEQDRVAYEGSVINESDADVQFGHQSILVSRELGTIGHSV